MKLENLLIERKDKKFYREGDILIKLFDETYSTANVFNEVLNQARVEETGLNIPKIREVTVIDGKWAISMDYIEGETLEEIMKREPDKRREHLELFIAVQRSIHEKKSPLLTKFKDKMINKIMQCELDASTRYDLGIRMSEMPMHNHLCHGDFNPSNVIITASGEPYILDWSHASQGNATADAAKTSLIFRMDGNDELAEEYISAYCSITGTPREYVEEWVPLVAAAQLVKVSPTARQKLMRYINGDR